MLKSNTFLILIFVFVVTVAGVILSVFNRNGFYTMSINGKEYKLLTAKTASEWTKGLMDYKRKGELGGADGMVFIFPNKELRQFWNQNTYLDLDVYWMDGDRVLGKSHLPPITQSKDIVVVYSPDKADKVVEIIR